MGREYEDFKIEREKLNAAKNAAKPNSEQIRAHIRDTLAKARKSLQEDSPFFEEKLNKLKNPR